MSKLTIADTGPIVGALTESEEHHRWTVEQMEKLTPPLLTCEAVITEACFLMHNSPDGEQDVLGLVQDGLLKIDFSLSEEIGSIRALMKKYEDVPMSLADACLVRLSELHEEATIFTLDSDFWVYRKNGKEAIPLIIPER